MTEPPTPPRAKRSETADTDALQPSGASASRPPAVAHTREHRLPDGELRLLGAWASVSGAMARVDLGGRVLIDCGVAQGAEAREFVFDPAALDVDAVLLTHGHNDHVGSLLALLRAAIAGPSTVRPPRCAWPRSCSKTAL